MSNHVSRIESVEKRLEAVKAEAAQKTDVGRVRSEMKTVFDSLRLEVLECVLVSLPTLGTCETDGCLSSLLPSAASSRTSGASSRT